MTKELDSRAGDKVPTDLGDSASGHLFGSGRLVASTKELDELSVVTNVSEDLFWISALESWTEAT